MFIFSFELNLENIIELW